ncbi:MAG: PIN domain-containing protein [Bifidobacteriaceae bacterium]|nr:PIN domain-containing protein [Bifidobacteriaceae bacterium]
MNRFPAAAGPPVQVVLADANVMYSRSLRDYLLYAAEAGAVGVAWSQAILDDVTEHLMANVPGFGAEAAVRLLDALAETFPDAVFEPSGEDYARLEGLVLRDEDDRHVMAAALAAEADIICTSNLKHFPRAELAKLGVAVMSPDDLFTQLIGTRLAAMIEAHRAAVANFAGSSDQSTVAALRRAGAARAADMMSELLGL